MSAKPDLVHLVCLFPPKVSTFPLMGTLERGNVSPTVTPAPGAMVLLDCGVRTVGISERFQPIPDCETATSESNLCGTPQ